MSPDDRRRGVDRVPATVRLKLEAPCSVQRLCIIEIRHVGEHHREAFG